MNVKAWQKLLHKPVACSSQSATLIVRLLWVLYAFYALIKRPQKARIFEENPLRMNKQDVLYLGYKYYYQSPNPDPKCISFFKAHPFVWQTEKNSPTTEPIVSISFGGDLMPYACINRKQCASLWEHIGADFFGSDIVFGNLETPINLSSPPQLVPEVMLGNMNFNAGEEQFEVFNGNNAYNGFDILSFANNHTLDQGEIGIQETVTFLQQKGIETIGVNPNNSAHADCKITAKNGIKIGWLAYTFCFNHHSLPHNKSYLANELPLNVSPLQTNAIKEKIDYLKSNGADFIIGSFHMGNAYQPLPNFEIIQNVQHILDECDIDFFIGTHPHNPQPLAVMTNSKGKKIPVIFSLGDFVAWDIYTFCHLHWVIKCELIKNKSGEVQVQSLENNLVYTHIDKQENLQFIPFKLLEKDKEIYKRSALFPSEIDNIIAFAKAIK